MGRLVIEPNLSFVLLVLLIKIILFSCLTIWWFIPMLQAGGDIYWATFYYGVVIWIVISFRLRFRKIKNE